MKIVNKPLIQTADVSSGRGTFFQEFWKLVLSAIILLIALYFTTGVLVDFCVKRISFKTEIRMFGFLQKKGITPENTEHRKRLEAARGILEKLRDEEGVPPLPFTLVLMENNDPNAFAFPGGTIGVSSGLLDALSDDIEIAFVLGHELGHFHGRDHLKGMGRAIGYSAVTHLLFGSTIGADRFGNILDLVLQRRYSREREEIADRFGMQLVHSVYGAVDGSERLFETLRDSEKVPQWAYMFATHPSPVERIEALERFSFSLKEMGGMRLPQETGSGF